MDSIEKVPLACGRSLNFSLSPAWKLQLTVPPPAILVGTPVPSIRRKTSGKAVDSIVIGVSPRILRSASDKGIVVPSA
ncbi:hypothetical protein GA0070215_107124 [Micromonospora marina]|uniref:Uncharacterized protein n=1 Tax=Micromonospora marina TaxID=307120 RepID=A0A1C4XG39_9ACTN|nr:hypothetical protein GA0070215_107124 [Micromonospora marina]